VEGRQPQEACVPLAIANIRQFTNCGLFVKISKGELDMTDNELKKWNKDAEDRIIKDLENCISANCSICQHNSEDGCTDALIQDALDLINRQKERIKELEERCNGK
jgi:hypothetical protein